MSGSTRSGPASAAPTGIPAAADGLGPAATACYRGEIDGLRALAVLAVIVYHLSSTWLPGGFLGVDVFFVISGYVITASIVGRGPQPLGPFLTSFYQRRVQRLAPALIACVSLTALLTCLFVANPTECLLTGATALFGVSNFYLHQQVTDYFGTDAALNTFTQTWSLGVEEQFYLGYPLIAWLLGLGRRRGLRGALPFLAMLLLVSLLSLQWFLSTSHSDPSAAYFLTTGRLWEMAAGGLLHELRRLPAPAWAAALPPLPAVTPFALLIGTLWMPSRQAALSTPLAVLATVLLLWALERPGLVKSGLMSPVLRHLGLISYSLYLWHWSVLCLGRWTVGLHGWWLPLMLMLMLGLAEGSYRFIETPLRRARWAGTSSGALFRGAGLSGGLAGLLSWLALTGTGQRFYAGVPTATRAEQLNRQRIEGTGIDRLACLKDRSTTIDAGAFTALVERCSAAPEPQARAPGAGRTLFVAGDSHAAALMPLEGELRRLGFGSAHLSMTGCPFPATAHGNRKRSCTFFQRLWAETILQQARPGDVLLIGGYWLSHLGDGIGDTRDDLLGANGRPVRNSAAKLRLLLDALNELGARAHQRGLTVLLVGAEPRLLERDTCLPEWFRPAATTRLCEPAFQTQLGFARLLNRDLARGLSAHISLIDPFPAYCGEDCTLSEMRTVLFDRDHPSDASVSRLAIPVLQAIAHPPSQTATERKAP